MLGPHRRRTNLQSPASSEEVSIVYHSSSSSSSSSSIATTTTIPTVTNSLKNNTPSSSSSRTNSIMPNVASWTIRGKIRSSSKRQQMSMFLLLVSIVILLIIIIVKKDDASLLFHSPTFLLDENHQEWKQKTYSSSSSLSLPLFVQWEKPGIDIRTLLIFMNDSAGITGPTYEPFQPDDLYIIQQQQQQPTTINDDTPGSLTYQISLNTYWKHPVSFRRRELTDGLNFLDSTFASLSAPNLTTSSWTRIRAAVSENKSFPLLIQWEERSSTITTTPCQDECCDRIQNPNGTIPTTSLSLPIPIVRFMASRNCKFRILCPSMTMLRLAKDDDGQLWKERFQTNEQQHPFSQKIKRIVYRGPHNLTDINNMLDVLHYDPSESYDMDHFQKYLAVLDIDSMQYPQLMCQNSVVLKTTTSCIDILVDTLKPWVHFIPIRSDLSDLSQQFQFILENEDKVKTIIQNANRWCASQLLLSNLQNLFLKTITEYLEHLDAYNHAWQEDIWKRQKDKYLSGHFFLYRYNLYILPKSVVGAIKQGLRRDDPSYPNVTIGNLER